jgi:hypothetical protein
MILAGPPVIAVQETTAVGDLAAVPRRQHYVARHPGFRFDRRPGCPDIIM